MKSIKYLSQSKTKKKNKNNSINIEPKIKEKLNQFKTINLQKEDYKTNILEDSYSDKRNSFKHNSLKTKTINSSLSKHNISNKQSTATSLRFEQNENLNKHLKRHQSMKDIYIQSKYNNKIIEVNYKKIVKEIYHIFNLNFNVKIDSFEKLPNIINELVINFKKNFQIVNQINDLYLEEQKLKNNTKFNSLNIEYNTLSNWINSTFSKKLNSYYKKQNIINEFDKIEHSNNKEINDSFLYKQYCSQIMSDNNINNFNQFTMFINKLLEENLMNDQFVLKMKNVLCSKTPILFKEKEY